MIIQLTAGDRAGIGVQGCTVMYAVMDFLFASSAIFVQRMGVCC